MEQVTVIVDAETLVTAASDEDNSLAPVGQHAECHLSHGPQLLIEDPPTPPTPTERWPMPITALGE